jgi:nicotinamidase-related amidase
LAQPTLDVPPAPSLEIDPDAPLFRHVKRPEWGVGMLVWERDTARAYQFEDGRLRKIREGYYALLERTSMNSWDDQKVRDALKRNGQKKVVVSGLWTEVCNNSFAFSAMSEGGYEIYMVADASGGTTKEAHDYSMQRMIQAGVVPVTWQQVLLEWQRDWARRDTYNGVMDIVREHSGAYGMGADYAYTMVHKAPERVKHGPKLDPVAAG